MPVGRWRFDGRMSELPRLHREVAEFARRNGISKKLEGEVALVLEEWFVNVVNHGLKGIQRPLIEITLKREAEWLVVELRDNGIAFDPWQIPPPDITSSLHERAVGGLGIHMIRSIMDRLGYCREGDLNLSRLAKKIGGKR